MRAEVLIEAEGFPGKGDLKDNSFIFLPGQKLILSFSFSFFKLAFYNTKIMFIKKVP
jgi:hypothetical protein